MVGTCRIFNSKPNSESKKVTAYLNLDNGLGAIRGIYLQANDFARPVFQEIFRQFSSTQQYYTTIEISVIISCIAYRAIVILFFTTPKGKTDGSLRGDAAFLQYSQCF